MSCKITFASLNVLGFPFGLVFKPQRASLRYRVIAEYFNSSDVDVLNFQEIISYAHLSLMQKHLKYFPYSAYKRSYFGPRGGLVTFSRTPITLIDFQDFHKSFYPFDRSMVEAFITKGMLVSKTDNNDLFLNTHLATTHDENWTENGKYFTFMRRQIGEFHAYIEYISKKYSSSQMIVSGDFNISRESVLYDELMSLNGLQDVFSDNHLPTYHKPFVRFGDPYCIDYIFTYGKKLPVDNQRYIFTDRVVLNSKRVDYASDHVGLQISAQKNENAVSIP